MVTVIVLCHTLAVCEWITYCYGYHTAHCGHKNNPYI